jgi:hypothetical protein
MALSSVGMFGDGSTHGSLVSSKYSSRDHRGISTTSSFAPMPKCSLNSFASSPMVMPCRIGIGNWPTNDSKPGSSIGPSTSTPPIGFGRSQTTMGSPCVRAARRQLAIV